MHYYLESYNLINKQLPKLEIENDEIIQSQEEIINKTKLFYETFCQKKIKFRKIYLSCQTKTLQSQKTKRSRIK